MVRLVKGDLDLLAKVVWAESRGQPFQGQCAIVWVILNRLHREPGRFPRTIQGIIRQPYAFSCFNKTDPQCTKVEAITEADPAYVEAMYAVTAVLTGGIGDVTFGSDHYHASSMKHPPKWAAQMTPRTVIGDHRFFSERPPKEPDRA